MRKDLKTLEPWLEGYLDYLSKVQRKSPATVRDVRCTLRKLSGFAEARWSDRPVWKIRLDDYLQWLNARREEGARDTVLMKELSHVRGLLDYGWRGGRCDRNVLDGFSLNDKQARRRAPPTLTLEEAKALVEATSRRTPAERRDRMMVLLLYGCGLRTAELCQLDVQDVDVERAELLVKKAKGDKQRVLPVPGGVWTELLLYLRERGGKRGPLFRTATKRRRVSVGEVASVVKALSKAAGLREGVTPRTLRHAFATHLMDQGVDLAVIASLMGHRTPKETGVYLHALPGRAQAAAKKLDWSEGGEE